MQNSESETKAFKNVGIHNVMSSIQVLFVCRVLSLNSSCALTLTWEAFKKYLPKLHSRPTESKSQGEGRDRYDIAPMDGFNGQRGLRTTAERMLKKCESPRVMVEYRSHPQVTTLPFPCWSGVKNRRFK